MLLFLYGEDDYRLKEKLKAIKKRYLDAAATEANLSVLRAEEVSDFEKIKEDIRAMPFLAKQRMIILENFLTQASKDLQEKLKDYLDEVPETSIVVFVEEGIPNEKNILFQKLQKIAKKIWIFNILKPFELEKWVRDKAIERKGRIDPQAVKILASYVGPDLWQMSAEIEKLILYKGKDLIKPADVDLLVKAKLDNNIFNLVDALGNRELKKAGRKLEELLKSGEPPLYILTMIIYQFRNILLVKDLLTRGKGKSEIAKEIKLHPFVLQKTFSQAENFSLGQLKKIYQYLVDADLAIKTGKIEPQLALNLLITKILK